MDLSSILSEATHAARYFTDASGAALALWSQGVVICRARSGDTAPPLGAKLDVDAGISGECLRSGRSQRCNDSLTDPRVNAEVCKEMDIRSLAAVPMRCAQGVIGILEVFSDKPNAFSDAHITLLKTLARSLPPDANSPQTLPASRPFETAPEPAERKILVPVAQLATRDWLAFCLLACGAKKVSPCVWPRPLRYCFRWLSPDGLSPARAAHVPVNPCMPSAQTSRQ
jgi:hypothetical protein